MPIFPIAREAHTSRSSTDKFGEAQAEGVDKLAGPVENQSSFPVAHPCISRRPALNDGALWCLFFTKPPSHPRRQRITGRPRGCAKAKSVLSMIGAAPTPCGRDRA